MTCAPSHSHTRARVLGFIQATVAETGVSPPERNIAAMLGIARSTAHYHVRHLYADGLLTKRRLGGSYFPNPAYLNGRGARKRTHCDVCGGSLEGMRADALHCSGACRAEASRRRKQAA